MPKIFDDILHGLAVLLAALAPAALGAAVAQAWERGLSWSQRLVQWAVGICVSYYVTGGIGAWLHLDPFVAQAIGFVLAMVAFRATPAFIASTVAVVGSLPSAVAHRFGLGKEDAS